MGNGTKGRLGRRYYTFTRTAGTARRAARYRQEAEVPADSAAEKDGAFQETLQTARSYDQLADALVPPEMGQ